MEMMMSNLPLIHVVDMQGDFAAGGKLPVTGAAELVSACNAFLRALNPNNARAALYTYDTHFVGEYRVSPEHVRDGFPDHCFYGTVGQKPIVINSGLAVPTFHMNKNEFSAWGRNPTDISKISFASEDERKTYLNLFHVTPEFNDLCPGTPRDEWLRQQKIGKETPIVIFGVASDFCVKQAIAGYLENGHQVIVLTDLVAGIGGNVSEVASGRIEDVAAQIFPAASKSGQLRGMTSADFLKYGAANAARFAMAA
jgi:nicotinamidase/pyrazinamidase